MKLHLALKQISRQANGSVLQFVPESKPVQQHDVDQLTNFISDAKNLLVLTGAGLSTESGIPDYRSSGVGLYARTARRPVQYQDFVRFAVSRQRYWARNFVAWPQFSAFRPNTSHIRLAEWQRRNIVDYIVTQNVDELHRKAGSERVIELHGSTHRITCLSCDLAMSRWDLQQIFTVENPGWHADVLQNEIAPDGDVILTDQQVAGFKVPCCHKCGGILKPDVVLFGDNVAQKVVEHVYDLVVKSDRLLVAGSSLFVYSGYRFVERARTLNKMVAIVNIGPTRADHITNIKIDARCSDILAQVKL